MRILITGMTAQQANPQSHLRVANYAGYLTEMMRADGHVVEWLDPKFSTDLDHYGKVIVGVGPITSLGANRTYGALNIIYQLWDSDKLKLMIDAPDPHKVTASLKAITDKPSNLLKEFFGYRKEYEIALEYPERMHEAVDMLYKRTWPNAIAPGLPWSMHSIVASHLPRGADNRMNLISVDHDVIKHWEGEPASLSNDFWAYEPGSDKKWLSTQNISWDYQVLPKSSRTEADRAAVSLLRSSGGCLIAPDRQVPWWNTRYGQAIGNGVPVFSDWKLTATLGSDWSHLPSVYERMASDNARKIADRQRQSYLRMLGTEENEHKALESVLNDDPKRRTT